MGLKCNTKALRIPWNYYFFYSNEHKPIHAHAHARYGTSESKIEIIVKNGIIQTLKLQKVPGRKPLPAVQAKDFKKLVKVLGDELVQSWINYFVYHKKIVPKKIAGKL